MIGIISDTHENLPMIARAVAEFRAHAPSLVIHCGDIISPPVLREFSGLPMRFVFGNNDGEREGIARVAGELGFGAVDDQLDISVSGKRIFVTHGHKQGVLERAIGYGCYDYVFTGHTHCERDERVGRTRVINPGALFAARRYTVVLLDLDTDTLEFREIPRS